MSTSSQRHTLDSSAISSYHPSDSMTQWLLFYPTTPSTPRPRARHVFSVCLLLIRWSFGMPCSRVAWRSGTALTYFPISTWTTVRRLVRRGSIGFIQEKHIFSNFTLQTYSQVGSGIATYLSGNCTNCLFVSNSLSVSRSQYGLCHSPPL